MSLTIARSCSPNAPSPWCEADTQRRNKHIALGTLLGLHKEVSTREAGLHWKQAQLKVRELQGQVWHVGRPHRDVEVSAENPAKGKMATSVGSHAVICLIVFLSLSQSLHLPPLGSSNQQIFIEPALCQTPSYR